MKEVTSAEFQRNFGLWKRRALVGPVGILVHGRPSVVLVSASHYEELVARAEAGGQTPDLSEQASTASIQEEDAAVAEAVSDADMAALRTILSDDMI